MPCCRRQIKKKPSTSGSPQGPEPRRSTNIFQHLHFRKVDPRKKVKPSPKPKK